MKPEIAVDIIAILIMAAITLIVAACSCGCSPVAVNVMLPGSRVYMGWTVTANSYANAVPEKWSEIGDAAHTVRSGWEPIAP